MDRQDLAFFSPAPHPADEAVRQALVDGFRFVDAAEDAGLAALVRRAAELFGAPSAAISIINHDRQDWIVRTGLDADGSARALSFCGHVVAAPDAVLAVPDACDDPRFAGNPLVTGAMASVRFYAGAPLVYEGSPLGALCVIDPQPMREIDEAKREALGRLAAEVMAILATYR